MLMRHHDQTHELEVKQQRAVHNLREDHIKRQHQTELNNQVTIATNAQTFVCGTLKVINAYLFRFM